MWQRQDFFIQGCLLGVNNVSIADSGEAGIAFPAVGYNRTARFHRSLNCGRKAGCRCVLDIGKANASRSILSLLDHDQHEHLPFCTPPTLPSLLSSNVGFINLYSASQPVSPRPDHCATKFVQPRPSRVIAPKSKGALESECISTVLLTCDMPHGTKPEPQGFLSILENRSRCDRHVGATLGTLIKARRQAPSMIASTVGTAEPLGPSQINKILAARLFRREPLFKVRKVCREVFHVRHTLHVVAT